MAETLLQFHTPIVAADGTAFRARACGAPLDGGPQWQGWIEFEPIGPGEAVRSGRETTQPNYGDAAYWAGGLTQVYLEGALARALKPVAISPHPPVEPPLFDGPAPSPAAHARDNAVTSVLDPFSVYEKGEVLLRRQLGALSAWHLVNIIAEYELSNADQATLSRMPPAALVDLIVEGVRAQAEHRHASAARRTR